jgi:23S rRNA (cytosine1962-C5)-methyltransferase
LKPYKEESLVNGHAWIFSGALQQPPRWIATGGLVDVKSSKGQFVARGYYNPQTDIAIRILTHDPEEAIDEAFVRNRVQRAVELRRIFQPEHTNAYRLIHSEGDGLPGLVVDRFANTLVMQIHTAGIEQLRPLIIDALLQETDVSGILLRNDSMSRRREGLEIEEPVTVVGEVPEQILIRENDVQFLVDPWQGQKTGFFLDQRDKRESLRKYAQGKRSLNCFSYTGGFSLYAALTSKETHVTSVDISASAIEASRKTLCLMVLTLTTTNFI